MQVGTLMDEMLRAWTLGEQAHLTALAESFETRATEAEYWIDPEAAACYQAVAARCRKAIDALANG